MKFTADLDARHTDFWRRKKEEIKMQDKIAGQEKKVTNNSMLAGLIDFWMRMEEQEVPSDG